MAFFTHITHESWSLPTPLLLCLNITEQKRRSHILDDPDAYFGIAHLSYLDKLAIRIDSHTWLNNNAFRLDSLSDPSDNVLLRHSLRTYGPRAADFFAKEASYLYQFEPFAVRRDAIIKVNEGHPVTIDPSILDFSATSSHHCPTRHNLMTCL